ncbi:MAG: Lrp/AsnC family transcriptional regulator [Candidatus Aenigmatarchaeota archaeon]
MIVQLDQKDKKILKELFDNARKPYSVIGRNTRLSKEVVNYRIKGMLESGVLTGFNTVIDVRRLGWKMFFVYVRLRNINVKEDKEIIEDLKSHKNISWLVRCIGNYDLILKVFVRDNEEIDEIVKWLDFRYAEHLDYYAIEYISEEHAVPFSFIYAPDERKVHQIKKTKKDDYSLSEIDSKILRELKEEARLPLSEMSERTNISRDLLNYHLKKLEKEKIILKYRPDVWPEKLGYNWHFMRLKLGMMNSATVRELNTYLLNQKNVTYFYNTVGESDVNIELRVKTTMELNIILMELRSILKTVLKRYEIMIILDEHIYNYFPDCLMKHQ